jgi:hypothetical protein
VGYADVGITHTVDGAIGRRNSLPLTRLGAPSPSTMWTAACAIIERPKYAQAKRRTSQRLEEKTKKELDRRQHARQFYSTSLSPRGGMLLNNGGPMLVKTDTASESRKNPLVLCPS